MTGTDILYNFRLGFDIIASAAAPGFTDTQVYSLMNRAKDELILEAASAEDLRYIHPLIVENATVVSATEITANLAKLALNPAVFWYYVSSSTTLNRATSFETTGIIKNHSGNGITSKNIFVAPDAFDKIDVPEANEVYNNDKFFKYPFCTLYGDTVSATPYDNVLHVIADGYSTITAVSLKCLKQPDSIATGTNDQFSDIFYRIIINRAIDIAKTIINIQEPQQTKN